MKSGSGGNVRGVCVLACRRKEMVGEEAEGKDPSVGSSMRRSRNFFSARGTLDPLVRVTHATLRSAREQEVERDVKISGIIRMNSKPQRDQYLLKPYLDPRWLHVGDAMDNLATAALGASTWASVSWLPSLEDEGG